MQVFGSYMHIYDEELAGEEGFHLACLGTFLFWVVEQSIIQKLLIVPPCATKGLSSQKKCYTLLQHAGGIRPYVCQIYSCHSCVARPLKGQITSHRPLW